MLPRATKKAVVSHMRPAGLELDHTGLRYRMLEKISVENSFDN